MVEEKQPVFDDYGNFVGFETVKVPAKTENT